MKTKIAVIVTLMTLLMYSCIIKEIDYENVYDHFYITNNTETDLIISVEFYEDGKFETKSVSPSSTIEIEMLQGAFGDLDLPVRFSILSADSTLIKEYASNSLIPWERSHIDAKMEHWIMTFTITDELLYGEPEQE